MSIEFSRYVVVGLCQQICSSSALNMRVNATEERIIVVSVNGRERGIVRRDQRGSCGQYRRWCSSGQRIALLGEKSAVLGSAQSIAIRVVIIVGALV